MEIVLFDLDHTIIDGDTDFLWGKFLVENNVVDKNYYESKNEYFFQEYQAGSLDPLEFARFSYKPLADNDYNRLLELREAFFTNKIRNNPKRRFSNLFVTHSNIPKIQTKDIANENIQIFSK